jgi:hypothetical protein
MRRAFRGRLRCLESQNKARRLHCATNRKLGWRLDEALGQVRERVPKGSFSGLFRRLLTPPSPVNSTILEVSLEQSASFRVNSDHGEYRARWSFVCQQNCKCSSTNSMTSRSPG